MSTKTISVLNTMDLKICKCSPTIIVLYTKLFGKVYKTYTGVANNHAGLHVVKLHKPNIVKINKNQTDVLHKNKTTRRCMLKKEQKWHDLLVTVHSYIKTVPFAREQILISHDHGLKTASITQPPLPPCQDSC